MHLVSLCNMRRLTNGMVVAKCPGAILFVQHPYVSPLHAACSQQGGTAEAGTLSVSGRQGLRFALQYENMGVPMCRWPNLSHLQLDGRQVHALPAT